MKNKKRNKKGGQQSREGEENKVQAGWITFFGVQEQVGRSLEREFSPMTEQWLMD